MIDPLTGQEIQAAQPQTVTVPAEEWAAIKARMDIFDKMGAFQAQQPVAPPIDKSAEKLASIETKLDALDADIDQAILEGRSIKDLTRKRDKLVQDKMDMRMEAALDPIRTTGLNAIDQLSSEVYKSQMPHLDFVKKDFEANLSRLPIEMRMTAEGKKMAYDLAVGINASKLIDLEREKMMRQATTQNLAGGSSGSVKREADVPEPAAVLPQEAMAFLRTSGKTADQFYQGLGFADWNDYFKKHKPYFEKKGFIEKGTK